MTSDSESPLAPPPDDVVAELLAQEPEPGHRVSERTTVTVAAGLLLVLSVVYLVQALQYSMGTLAQPGPGLFPRIIAVGLVIAAIGLGVESLRLPRERFVVVPFASYMLRLGLALAASVVYILIITTVGQFIAGFMLCVAMLFAMRSRRWWLSLILAAVFSAAVVLLFGTILGIPLPSGPRL